MQLKKKIILSTILFVFIYGCSDLNQPISDNTSIQIYQKNKKLIINTLRNILYRNLVYSGLKEGITVLNIFDFDHTIADTLTMIPVKGSDGKIRKLDSKCMDLKKGDKPDFSVLTREEVYDTIPINPALERLEKYVKEKNTLNFIITARGGITTYTALYEYLAVHKVAPNGIYAVHSDIMNRLLWERMELPQNLKKLPHGLKKPLLIAGLVDIINNNSNIQIVRYFEDTDEYLVEGLKFLPSQFKNIRFEWYDYIRSRNYYNEFEYYEDYFAFSEKGINYRTNGSIYMDEQIKIYDSKDCPLN